MLHLIRLAPLIVATVGIWVWGIISISPAAGQERTVLRPPDAALEIIRADAPIEANGSPVPLVEPYATVHPGDPNHVVVGTIVAPSEADSPWHCAAFTSFDGGASWSRHDFAMQRCIDPWIVFAESGDVLFTAIDIENGYEEAERFHLLLFRSSDGGRTWSAAPTSLGRTHDHSMLAVDRGTGAVYLTSQRTANPGANPHVYIGRSDDHGRTWQEVARAGADSLASKPTGIVLLGSDTVYVAYEESIPDWEAADTNYVRAVRTDDGGQTFSGPYSISNDCDIGRQGFPGYPFLAVDRSAGLFDGRLYHACILTDLAGVGLTYSTTGGLTWSNLVRVDMPPNEGEPYARTPMLAVSTEGTVGVAWYDRRNDPARECQDVYFAASIDGGETFLPDRRISTQTSCPNSPGNGRASQSWPMGGDYSSLAAGPDGHFRLVWADSRTGLFQLRHAQIAVNDRDR